MSTKDTTLNKRIAGFAIMVLPARTFRIIDVKIRMNAVGKSHKTPNNRTRPDAFSLVTLLLSASRMANGRTMIQLIIAADQRSLVMVFILFP